MDEQLRVISDRFVDALRGINAIYFERPTVFHRFAAMILTMTDVSVLPTLTKRDTEQACRIGARLQVAEKEVLPVLAAICHCTDDRIVQRVARAQRILEHRFFPSAHLITAAWLMALDQRDITSYDQVVEQARQDYDGMRGDDPLHTNSEDVPLCVLYALTGEKMAVRRLDEVVKQLRPVFRFRNSVQTLAEVLLLGKAEDVSRTMALSRELTSRGLRLGHGSSFAALGVLAAVDGTAADIAERVETVELRLRKAPELSGWKVSGKERLMWSCLLTAVGSIETKERQQMLCAAFVALYGAYLPDPLKEPEFTMAAF